MASTKKYKKTFKKLMARTDLLKTVGVSLEVAFRIFTGVILLTKLDGYWSTVAAVYALTTGLAIVLAQIFKANK